MSSYFVKCPNDGIATYATEAEALAAAVELIGCYYDEDGWQHGVDQIVAGVDGVVTHKATQTNLIKRVGELDEDGHDEAGEYWGNPDWEYCCNYEMLPIAKTQEVLP